MIVVGVPYSCKEISETSEMSGGGPYGASAIAGSDGKRQPSANELAVARFQGRHVADVARPSVAREAAGRRRSGESSSHLPVQVT